MSDVRSYGTDHSLLCKECRRKARGAAATGATPPTTHQLVAELRALADRIAEQANLDADAAQGEPWKIAGTDGTFQITPNGVKRLTAVGDYARARREWRATPSSFEAARAVNAAMDRLVDVLDAEAKG